MATSTCSPRQHPYAGADKGLSIVLLRVSPRRVLGDISCRLTRLSFSGSSGYISPTSSSGTRIVYVPYDIVATLNNRLKIELIFDVDHSWRIGDTFRFCNIRRFRKSPSDSRSLSAFPWNIARQHVYALHSFHEPFSSEYHWQQYGLRDSEPWLRTPYVQWTHWSMMNDDDFLSPCLAIGHV